MAITKNIVTDYGADDTGAVATTAALYTAVTGFRAQAAGQDATLTFPDNGVGHRTYQMVTSGGGTGISWSQGTNSLVVNVTGATMNGTGVILGAISYLNRGLDDANGVSARIRTVNAGATRIQLTAESAAAGYIARATAVGVGGWICVTGFDTQGVFLSAYGQPPNSHFFDYVQITAIGADTIDFTPALSNYYSDQWPCYNKGSSGEIDSGGPATVFFMHSGWVGPVTFNGGTYDSSGQVGCGGRDFVINGGTTSNNTLLMSTNKSYRAYNHNNTGLAPTEHDKLNDYVYIEGGSYGQWHCQSSSNRYLEMRNVTLNGGASSLNGTVKNTVLDGCTINGSVLLGPAAFGIGETFTARNCTISGAISGIGNINTDFPVGTSMANGIITMPLSESSLTTRALIPDSYGRNIFFWKSNSNNDTGSSRIISVTADVWPPADIQTVTTNITITNSDTNLTTSASLFVPGDVGKVIIVNNGGASSSQRRTVITQYNSATSVEVGTAFQATLVASSQQIQWGTCNVYVQTNDTGGFPASKLISGYTSVGLRSRGVRTVSFENCTGTEQAVDLSQAAARNLPFASYTKRQYTGEMPTAASSGMRLSAAGAVAGTGSTVPMVGFIQSLKINVITPYTGATGTLTAGLAQFGINLNVNGTNTGFNPRVNMKIAGERIFTPGVTPTGLQTGDTLPTLPADGWIKGSFDPTLSSNVTSEYLGNPSLGPIFTIEMITTQGDYTGPTAVAPLRLRLRV